MLGAILGDIIGSVYEWHNVKTEDFPLFCSVSHFTDDSVLSVAIADKLLSYTEEKTLFSQKNNAKAYAMYCKQYYFRYSDAGFGEMFASWSKSKNLYRQKSYGNGSAMRVCPIGFAFDNLDKVLSEAKLNCLYTHNNREAIKGAKAIAGCVFLAKNNSSKMEIKAFIEKKIGYSLNFTLQQIRPSYTFNSRANYTVPPAIAAFLESDSYESAIRKAISIGGDSDTIACMTGGIAEAYYKIIPEEIKQKGYLILDSGLRITIRNFYKKFLW